jgi:pimeloyl-ACP methyl ester carboxylesterase
MKYTHVNGPTQFVQANGIRFAYRRFGEDSAMPLLFMQHFRGGMDHWDPAVTGGFAKDRPVILFDNAGVASSSGETPDTIDAMANHAEDFVNALGLSQMDRLGFSIGGFVAQTFTLRHPNMVRRLMLVRTGPRGVEHRRTQTTGSVRRQPILVQARAGSMPSCIVFPSFRTRRGRWQGFLGAAASSQERCRPAQFIRPHKRKSGLVLHGIRKVRIWEGLLLNTGQSVRTAVFSVSDLKSNRLAGI